MFVTIVVLVLRKGIHQPNNFSDKFRDAFDIVNTEVFRNEVRMTVA